MELAVAIDTVVETEPAKNLVRVWCEWRGDRLLPNRADMKLEQIIQYLPFISMLEIGGPDAITFRLAGSMMELSFGAPLAGINLKEITEPANWAIRSQRLCAMAAQPCGAVMKFRRTLPSGQLLVVESLSLPILPKDPAGPMQMINIISDFSTRIRQENMEKIEVVEIPEEFQTLDLGAGLPVDPKLTAVD
jgi:hypothetical protein